MQYIVLDLEWNQALSKELIRRADFTLAGEIIQIGAVRLGEDLEAMDTLRLAVAPKYYKKMHWSVRRLTGISTKSLADGLPFPTAYEQFMDWCGEDPVFLTWGPDDLPMLKTNLRLHKMDLSTLPPSYDLQKIYARTLGEKRQFSLSDAMENLGIESTIPAHDALNDALNTARICRRIPLAESIAHYNDPLPAAAAESPSVPDGVRYESTAAMMEAIDQKELLCPHCGAVLSFGKWVRRAPGKRITLAACSCGASLLRRLYWKTASDSDAVVASDSLADANDTQAEAYRRALSHRRRSRRHKAAPAADAAKTKE